MAADIYNKKKGKGVWVENKKKDKQKKKTN